MGKNGKSRYKFFNRSILGLLLLWTIFSILHIDGRTSLYGVTDTGDNVEISLESLYNGEWQNYVQTNYQNNFPFRALMVKTNNQLLYQIGATINGSIVVGKNGYLFSDEYIQNSFSSISEGTKDEIDRYVANLVECQKILNEHSKELVYVISPSKVEICPDFLPDRYKVLVSERNDIINMYDYLAYKLSQTNIKTVDMTKILKESENPYLYFCKTGTHWNYYAASLGAQELLSVLGDTVVKLDIEQMTEPYGTEQDLYKLANIWKGKEENQYYRAFLLSNK